MQDIVFWVHCHAGAFRLTSINMTAGGKVLTGALWKFLSTQYLLPTTSSGHFRPLSCLLFP